MPEYIFIDDKKVRDGKKPAEKITEHLAIAQSNKVYDQSTWRIYSVDAEKPVMDFRINNYEAAKELAEIIEGVYGDYLSIYEVVPDWDVLAIARLSMDGGEKLYNTLHEYEGGIITLEDMKKAKEKALA